MARRRRPALARTPRITSAPTSPSRSPATSTRPATRDYARRIAWPVLRSVAEFIVSRVVRTRRGYEILGTVGPREVYTSVDNNAYTNMSAALALEAAVDCATHDRRASAGALERDRRGSGRPAGPAARRDHQPRRARLVGAAGRRPGGRRGPVPARLSDGSADGARDLSLRGRRAGAAVRRRADAQRLAARLRRASRRAGPRRRVARDAATATSSTSRSSSPTSTRGRGTDRPRASPMFANLSGYLTGLLYGFTGLRPSPGGARDLGGAPGRRCPKGWRRDRGRARLGAGTAVCPGGSFRRSHGDRAEHARTGWLASQPGTPPRQRQVAGASGR